MCARFLALLVIAAVALGADPAAIDRQIRQAREQSIAYLQTKDERAKKGARTALAAAEKELKDELKRNPACEQCRALLMSALFDQVYFGYGHNWDYFMKEAESANAQFPSNSKITYLKGYAHYYYRDYATSSRLLRRAIGGVDPQMAATIRPVLEDSQRHFVAEWNRQADFYQSRESRLESYNPQAQRMEILFQVTPQLESELGNQGFTSLTSNAPKSNDPEIQGYLERLMGRLLAGSPGSAFQYRLTVVESPEINAVTPPGHVIVYTGLLAFAETEGQLVGILSHELAHNYAHHHARALIKQMMGQNIVNAITANINPQQHALAAWAAALGTNFGLTLFTKAYSRFEEKEADLYGAHIMFSGGYNPADAASFFLKLQAAGQRQPVKLLSTHPPFLDRATYLSDYLENFPFENREFRSDSEEFQKIHARLTVQRQPRPAGGNLPPI